MQYRKDSSKDKKFTKTPEDFNELIKRGLLEGLEEDVESDEKQLIVSGRIYPEELTLKLSLTEKSKIKCHNFNGSIDHDTEAGDLIDRAQNLMEALSSMMMEFLEEEGDLDMPLDWHEFDFDPVKIYLMYSTENDAIDAKARELLGEDDPLEMESTDLEYVGKDFFKEAEEKFKNNVH